MKRVALSGGRGRLAPLIARHFVSQGFGVRLFSRCAGDGLEPLDRLTEPKLWEEVDVLIHCGWSCVPLTAERHPENAARQDLPLLRGLLQAAGAAGTPARMVFLSTGAIYGDTGEEPAKEAHPPRPLGAYARGKAEAEKLLGQSGVPSLILRVSNLLGEKPDPERPQGVLPRMIHAAKTGGEIAFWGDGSATKDYLHCSDFLSALQALLEQDRRGIFNISSGESFSLRELADLVEERAGGRLRIRHEPHFPWDVSFSRISNQKLRDQTGWSPAVSVREAVSECFSRFS
jgi:UDP-glucose 4-epimerase